MMKESKAMKLQVTAGKGKTYPRCKNRLFDILTTLSPTIPAKIEDLAQDVFGGTSWADRQSVISSISALREKGWHISKGGKNNLYTLLEADWEILCTVCAQNIDFIRLTREKVCHTYAWMLKKAKSNF